MSERYSRLFSLEPNQYSEGSPVLISAGALLKDNVTGQILAQLKFKNISPKNIKAVKVTVFPHDAAGRPLGSRVEHQYLDLKASRDVEFGQKEAIPIPDLYARGFSATVSEVVLSDNSIYSGNGNPFVLPNFVPLEQTLNDPELQKQFSIECGVGCQFVPQKVLNLWYCTCGQLNHSAEAVCHKCGRAFAQLSKAIDPTYLTEAMNKRLAEEAEAAARARAEAEARAKAEAEEQAREEEIRLRKVKRNRIIAVAVLAVVAAITVWQKVIIPNGEYNDAIALMNAEKYTDAAAVFEDISGYKDSDEKRNECLYQQAVIYRNAKNWDSANVLFEEIKNYKDSAELLHYHSYAVKKEEPASCTTEGYKLFNCSCGDEYTEKLTETGHRYSAATCAKPKECSVCGVTSGVALGHVNKGGDQCPRCSAPLKPRKYSGEVKGAEIRLGTLPAGKYSVKLTVSEETWSWGSKTNGNAAVAFYTDSTSEPFVSLSATSKSPTVKTIQIPETNSSIILFIGYLTSDRWELSIVAVD